MNVFKREIKAGIIYILDKLNTKCSFSVDIVCIKNTILHPLKFFVV